MKEKLPSDSTYKAIMKSKRKNLYVEGKPNPRITDIDRYRKEHFKRKNNHLLCKCRRCGKWKPFDIKHFSSHHASGTGKEYLRTTCRICWNLQKTERYSNRYKTDPTLRYYHYKYYSEKIFCIFDLTYDEFESLVYQPCFYCGYIPESGMNGVDRIDSNKSYIKDNVVSCCKVCNMMKGAVERKKKMKLDKINFLEHCKKIVKYQSLKS